jgi:anion-transporting  ArsA/GET3 family ATPase
VSHTVQSLLDRRLLFVTGKGGTGKTTIAAGLAWLLANSGKRVLACEVDAKGDLAAAFEAGKVGFDPVSVPGGPQVMSMDTEASLREYLRLQLRVPVVGRIGPLAAAFDFVAAAAPGVREILTVGKLCYEVRAGHYDVIVVDAAATGHVLGHLTAPQAINDLVKVGLIRSQTDWMLDLLNDPATTGVVVVATPEEMPVTESIELIEAIRTTTHVDVAGVVMNRTLPELFGVRDEARFATLSTERPGVLAEARFDGVFAAARHATARRRLAAEHTAVLRAAIPDDLPLVLQPYLFTRTDGLRATRQVAANLASELS